jgi:CheY-like chemotaxis protein
MTANGDRSNSVTSDNRACILAASVAAMVVSRGFVDQSGGNPMADPKEESRHILVVNDTEEILDLFRDIIESLGYRMTAWSFSPDDLAKVTEILPDLIILDLMVGPTELQGWALLQKLRMSPPTEDIPVIVCTAATNWVREQEGWLAANAVKVVLKPFKVAHLEHAIEQALDLPEVTASGELVEESNARPPSRQPPDKGSASSKPH